MATALKTPSVDTVLNLLTDKWNDVDATAEIWGQLEPIDHEVFELEWSGIVDGLMKQMKERISEMTPTQKRRYDELLALVAQKQPTLKKLFAS